MFTTKWLLAAAVSLAILFPAAGCTIVGSRHGGSEGDRKTAISVRSDSQSTKQEEVTGKVVRATPCRTLVEIEATKADETIRLLFFCFDPETRENAKDVKEGDIVKIQYVFSPETQRNQIRKITKAGE